jgi:hypothetical protein
MQKLAYSSPDRLIGMPRLKTPKSKKIKKSNSPLGSIDVR